MLSQPIMPYNGNKDVHKIVIKLLCYCCNNGNYRYISEAWEMIRAAVAGVVGFILIVIESMIVMKLKGLVTIEFGGIVPFINVWAMNFFFVFAILTQVTNWYRDKESLKEGNSF